MKFEHPNIKEIRKDQAENPLSPSGKKREEPVMPPDGKKGFEEYASKEARKYNSFIENLLGKGTITKEDIIRVDAELENGLRDKINGLKEKRARYDDIQPYQRLLEYLEKAKGIYKSTAKVFGHINSVTHAYQDKEIKAMGVDIVGEKGKQYAVYHEPFYTLLKELEESRISAIKKLIEERKQE